MLLRKLMRTVPVSFRSLNIAHHLSRTSSYYNSTKTLSQCISPKSLQFCYCHSASTNMTDCANTPVLKSDIEISDNCDVKVLSPPESVRGMTDLDCDAFNKKILVPGVTVNVKNIKKVLDVLKKFILKLHKFQSTVECPSESTFKLVYLCPLSFPRNRSKIINDLDKLSKELECQKVSDLVSFSEHSIELSYINWNAEDTLKSVLPLDNDVASGFSIIGHILHLNLRDHLLPYKKLIGQVLLDKTRASLIVNKVDTIDDSDNSYRSFNMEVLAGEGDTVATVRENKCTFELDFAKVYWNPRLETEHSMVVKKFRRDDVLYDVMAGVGPFSIPAARNGQCTIIANDLNPESYRWLKRNCKLNKVEDSVCCYNMDGSEFIRTELKKDLVMRCKDESFENDIHITMNLPAMAIEFLPNYVGLLKSEDISELPHIREPIVNVYMFSRDMKASSCMTRVAFYLGLVDHLPDFDGKIASSLRETYDATQTDKSVMFERPKFVDDRESFNLPALIVKDVRYVRKVSRNKIMVRVTFVLTKEIMLSDKIVNLKNVEKYEPTDDDINPSKRIKLDE